MKVNSNQKNILVTAPSFKGFEHKKSNIGMHEYIFNLPYDDTKYDAKVEFFKVSNNNKNGKFVGLEQLSNNSTNSKSSTLKKVGTKINLSNDYGLDEGEPFGYRYKLVNKGTDDLVKYITESGILIDAKDGNGKINLYCPSGTTINKGGAMLLGMYDNYNAGFVYDDDGGITFDKSIKDKAANSSKTFSNKLGGTLAGLEQNIPKLQEVGYSRVLLTPIFTDDSLSSHGYWIKNPYQMTQSAGNINNYESLTKKMFKAGINLVADGAFVNEGLEGVHFKDVLKWGKKSPYYEWFRFSGIEGGPLSMGVFSKNQKFIAHKVVNSPYTYIQNDKGVVTKSKNNNYDPKKPTYIQIFDKRLVSADDAKDSQKLIRAYDKLNTDNLYDINTHNDTVIPYSFEIRAENYDKNINDFNEMNSYRKDGQKKIPIGSPLAARILTKSDSYILEDKFENKFETWDANTDIAKINYITSEADLIAMKSLPKVEKDKQIKRLAQRNAEAQDFAVTAAKYWTKKTSDIMLVCGAQELGKIGDDPEDIKEEIEKLVEKGDLPKSLAKNLTTRMIKNALNKDYPLLKNNRVTDRNDLLISGMMDLPLESIELGDDISALLGYPQVTKRSYDTKYAGISKYWSYQDSNPQLRAEYEDDYSKMQEIYETELKNFGVDVIGMMNKELDSSNKLLKPDNTGNATKFGAYVLPIIGQDIAKFAIIKSLYPSAAVHFKDGKIIYDYDKLKEVSLKDIGVKGESPAEQATQLISHIKSGVKKISDSDKKELAKALYERVKDTNINSFTVSELMVDRAEAGLDWRIDAAKDIADTDALRNGHSTFETYWDNVIKFWNLFTTNVRQENPNSYFTAEITDEWSLMKEPYKAGNTGRFGESEATYGTDAVNKFLQETGIQSTPNYSYFFTDLLKTISKNFENGEQLSNKDRNTNIHDLLVKNRHYLNSTGLDSLIYSYTFAGNHDKPRTLHCLGLDMELFHTDFKDNQGYRRIAADVLGKDKNSINFNIVSGKAIAMGDVAKSAFNKAIDEKIKDEDKRKDAKNAIAAAISDLAQGSYMDKHFSPDVFGVKPYDKTVEAILTQAEEKHGLDDSILSESDKKAIANKTFENMLAPAMSKFKMLMNYLVLLPGNPTLFAGDELGATGYDEKCKNVYLQNRAYLNWDYVDETNKNFKAFLKKDQDDINAIMNLRARPELTPLNTGTPYALKPQTEANNPNKIVNGLLSQGANGAMVISLFNVNGTTLDAKKGIEDSHVLLDNISLGSLSDEDGIKGGLPENEKFYEEGSKDGSYYKVDIYEGGYVINKYDRHKKYQQIDVSKPTLVLHNNEEIGEKALKQSNMPAFTGKRVLYNPQYQFVSDPYKKTEASKNRAKIVVGLEENSKQ